MTEDKRPNPRDFIANLGGSMSVRRKLMLFLKNNVRKVATRRSCCGHPGEPGC